MATKLKNGWILLFFLLAGLVIGGLVGKITEGTSGLWWLSYGQRFGLESPVILNLGIIELTFGIMFNINIASIIGMIIALIIYYFIYKRV